MCLSSTVELERLGNKYFGVLLHQRVGSSTEAAAWQYLPLDEASSDQCRGPLRLWTCVLTQRQTFAPAASVFLFYAAAAGSRAITARCFGPCFTGVCILKILLGIDRFALRLLLLLRASEKFDLLVLSVSCLRSLRVPATALPSSDRSPSVQALQTAGNHDLHCRPIQGAQHPRRGHCYHRESRQAHHWVSWREFRVLAQVSGALFGHQRDQPRQ